MFYARVTDKDVYRTMEVKVWIDVARDGTLRGVEVLTDDADALRRFLEEAGAEIEEGEDDSDS